MSSSRLSPGTFPPEVWQMITNDGHKETISGLSRTNREFRNMLGESYFHHVVFECYDEIDLDRMRSFAKDDDVPGLFGARAAIKILSLEWVEESVPLLSVLPDFFSRLRSLTGLEMLGLNLWWVMDDLEPGEIQDLVAQLPAFSFGPKIRVLQVRAPAAVEAAIIERCSSTEITAFVLHRFDERIARAMARHARGRRIESLSVQGRTPDEKGFRAFVDACRHYCPNLKHLSLMGSSRVWEEEEEEEEEESSEEDEEEGEEKEERRQRAPIPDGLDADFIGQNLKPLKQLTTFHLSIRCIKIPIPYSWWRLPVAFGMSEGPVNPESVEAHCFEFLKKLKESCEQLSNLEMKWNGDRLKGNADENGEMAYSRTNGKKDSKANLLVAASQPYQALIEATWS